MNVQTITDGRLSGSIGMMILGDKTTTHIFVGDRLNIMNVSADQLDIQAYGGLIVEISGGQNILTNQINGAIIIEGMKQEDTIQVPIIHSGITFNGVAIMGEIDTGQRHENSKAKIRIPYGFPVNLINVNGKVDISDTKGPLYIVTSQGRFSIGTVSAANINVFGTAEVKIKEVSKSLEVKIEGTGSIAIEDGNVEIFTAQIHGHGDLRYGGRATHAFLSAINGSIKANFIENQPDIKTMDGGTIKVNNW